MLHRVWFSKMLDGRYVLTRLRPKLHQVGLSDNYDYYIPYGDPWGYRYICETAFHVMTNLPPIEVGQQIRVSLTFNCTALTLPLSGLLAR